MRYTRLRGGGSGGTALPGLVIEKTDPGFLRRTLDQLPLGVVVVSGTNGKTTTTKMVVQLLREQGLRVLINRLLISGLKIKDTYIVNRKPPLKYPSSMADN